MRTKRTATTPLLLVASLGIALSGCGGSDDAAENAASEIAEQLAEQQTGGDVDLNVDDDGAVRIETDEGSATYGMNKVPESWPSDIALPEGLAVVGGSDVDSGEGLMTTITATTDMAPGEVLDFFKAELADWEISNEVSTTVGEAELAGAQWDNGSRVVQLSATGSGDDKHLTLAHTDKG